MTPVLLSILLFATMLALGYMLAALHRLRQQVPKLRNVEAALESDARRLESLANAIQSKTVEFQAHVGRLAAEYQTRRLTYEKDHELLVADYERRRRDLEKVWSEQTDRLDQLHQQVKQYSEAADMQAVGFYEKHFAFNTLDEYHAAIAACEAAQKVMLRADEAVLCGAAWVVGGSEREGARMQAQYSKLMLRAFNGECDAATARVRWNNIKRMENRIDAAFDAVNALGKTMHITITDRYRDLRLEELRLHFERDDKRHEEMEALRKQREDERDEEIARREQAQRIEEAAREEERAKKELERAKREAASKEKIAELEARLAEALANSQRAVSLAELTKRGSVYVISNIGSFGETVYKIGMSRRLHWEERIEELSNASVPFPYDIHLVVHTDDAPALEAEMHQKFAETRVNLVNPRKEFFQANIDDIETFARSKNGIPGFRMEMFGRVATASQYRQTIARRQEAAKLTPEEHRSGVIKTDELGAEQLTAEPASAGAMPPPRNTTPR